LANSLFQITKRPPKAAQQYKVVQDEVRVGLRRVGDRTEKAYQRVVQNWQSKPGFKAEIGLGTKQLYVRVKVTGTRRVIDNWIRIDKKGMKPRLITPKRSKFLRFVWGGPGSYDAKTKANPARFGGSGRVANGKVVYFKFVNHPGFKPRKFSEAINKDARIVLDKEVKNGYQRGLRRAIKG
jgi:hypothetical protein